MLRIEYSKHYPLIGDLINNARGFFLVPRNAPKALPEPIQNPTQLPQDLMMTRETIFNQFLKELCEKTGVQEELILSPNREWPVVRARDMCIVKMRELEYTQKEISRKFRKDVSSIGSSLKRSRNRRWSNV